MNKTLEQIGLCGIVPVVTINDARHAGPLAEALSEGGLPCIEVTFRTAAAPAAIGAIAKQHPSMLLGAGTVLTVDQAKQAVDLGSRYIVSPGLNRKVVEYCLTHDIPITPGVATPTEVEAALDLGLNVVKFFPAEPLGGLPYLKAIAAPYTLVKFIPTGGIDESNLLGYLKFPSVVACGGSWMVKADLISGGRFDEIRAITSRAVGQMLGFTLRHSAAELSDAAIIDLKDRLAQLLALSAAEIEPWSVTKAFGQPSGEKPEHLFISTNFINRAVAYFERRGVAMRPGTREEKNRQLLSVEMDREVDGISLRLLQA
jgi:2-dehydro-3-deoxyphosphogluconate aldolase / (4S)-4-hydroxy-2-oxoglutarate aldolase